jgi:hypothetical protein
MRKFFLSIALALVLFGSVKVSSADAQWRRGWGHIYSYPSYSWPYYRGFYYVPDSYGPGYYGPAYLYPRYYRW